MGLDKQKLLSDGFLSFNLKDIDEDLYNELYTNFNKNIALNKINSLRYDGTLCINDCEFSIEDIDSYFNNLLTEYNLSYGNDIRYSIIPDDPTHISLSVGLNVKGSYDSLNQFENKLKNISSHISQIWYFNADNEFKQINNVISKIYKKIISDVYLKNTIHDYNFLSNDLFGGSQLTLYTKGNKIGHHQDGYSENRLCVILIYLNDDFQAGYGGELVIQKEINIPPIFGNVAILDFTMNNPMHSVNQVLDDEFKRFAVIRFFYKDDIK
jgi:hypothetical protein